MNETEDFNAPVTLTLKTGDSVNLIAKKKIAEDDQSTRNLRKSLITKLNTVSDEENHYLQINVSCCNFSKK